MLFISKLRLIYILKIIYKNSKGLDYHFSFNKLTVNRAVVFSYFSRRKSANVNRK